MGFKEKADLDCEVAISIGGVDKKTGKANPRQVEGYFIGTKEVADKFSKSGIGYLHIFQTAGGNIGVFGKTDLNRKLKGVVPGTMTRVTENGTVDTKYGPMRKYKLEVDEENTIEVDLITKGEIASDDDVVQDDTVSEVEDPLDEVPYTPPSKPARAASTPDATRQAKVQALLAGNRIKS